MKTKWCLIAAAGLSLLLPREAGATGACTSARFHDWQDMGCNQNHTSAGGSQAPKPCPCKNQPPAHGMPQWWVSEPYINLCMSDIPLSYTMSSGKEMDFQFYYRQRTKLPESDEVSVLPIADVYPGMANSRGLGANCGTNASWGNNWTMSISVWDPTWDNSWTIIGTTEHPPAYTVYSHGYQAFVWRPEGGLNYFNVPIGAQNTFDPKSLMRITAVTGGQNYPVVWNETGTYGAYIINNQPSADANGIFWGDSGIGLKLVYPDGSQDVFGLTAYPVKAYSYPTYMGSPSGYSTTRLLLTQRIDPQGRTTSVGYEQETNTIPYAFRVRYVVDPDGRTNTFTYSSGFLLTEIDDPYARKVRLAYDAASKLTNIVDAVSNTNGFAYQGTNGWITNLTTPYGNTSFSYYEVPDAAVTNGFQQRAVYVSEPTGAQQLYFYQHTNTFMSVSETSPSGIPGQTNFDDGSTSGTSGHGALTYRNTFHWGRRQFAALSSSVQSAIGSSLSTALGNLTAADYKKADLKHWLLLGADDVSITEALSSERDPSPDAAGTTPGLRTWYNYAGKSSPELLGSSVQVSCIARLLPAGTNQYTTYNYYATTSAPGIPVGAGFVSDNESSYSQPDGSIGVLTNWFQYAANSVDLTNTSNSVGQYVNYVYNGSHQITNIVNALNQRTTLIWDGSTFNLVGVQWPAGKSISLSYNAAANPPTSTSSMLQQISVSPEGRTFTINGYQAGNPSNITDDRGLTVANTWDGLNRLTGTSFPDNTTISNIYYRLDLVAAKDRLNNWTYYSFDGLQHLATVTNANNAVTTYSWCGCGSLTAILDALTNLTQLNYDNQGNLTNVVFPDYSSVTYQFDLAGRMTNAFDGTIGASRYLALAYDNQGLVTNITSANGTLQSAIYDALNRPISVTDANGVTVTNQFDAINELLKRTWPDGISEGYGYSTNGLIAYTNRDQKVTRYVRDGAGRLTAVTNANLEVTQFGYDSLDNVTSLIDGLLHQTTWQYNQYGWLTNKVDGLNRTAFRYAYNANGWLTNRWTPEQGNTGYTYDNVGNLKSIVYPSSTITYAYNLLNELTNMVDAVGTHNFSWTAAGQLQSESDAWATVSYTYVQGLRTALNIGSWSQSYGFDNGWRLQTLASPAGSFGYSYNFQPASSLVTGISLPNGANIVNSYDSLARLTGTALNNHWAHPLDSYTYTPDALGLRTNLVRNLGLTSSTVTAGFDNIGQLTSWNAVETGGTPRQNEQLGFGYDAAHNLHTRNNGSLAQTFTTDAANQLNSVSRSGTFTMSGATPAPATSVTVNGQAAQTYGDFTFAATNLTLLNGSNTFTNIAQNTYGLSVTNTFTLNLPSSVTLGWDANGNLTNDGVKVLSYDAENQLTNVTVPNSIRKDFAFDGLNRLRIKREYTWSGSAWMLTNEIHLVWDGNNIIQLRDSNNVPTLTLTRGLDLSGSLQGAGGIGGLLAMTDGGNTNYYYHQDGAGNVTALMDASENVVARRMYDGFGRTLRLSGNSGINPFWFSSQLHDESLDMGSYYHRNLWHGIQRWGTPDLAGLAGGINPYEFVGNNPVTYVDPFGLQSTYFDSNYGDISSYSSPQAQAFWGAVNQYIGEHMPMPGNGIAGAEMEGPLMGMLRNEFPEQFELPLLPKRPGNAGKTSGVLCDKNGNQFPLTSGRNGPAQNAPKGSGSGFDLLTSTHVEGHAAALMDQLGMSDATLHINNPEICPNCSRNLPSMLPSGSTLTVVLPDGTPVTFVGK